MSAGSVARGVVQAGRYAGGDQQRTGGERAGVQQQHGRRVQHGDQQPGERRAEQSGEPTEPVVQAGGPGQLDARAGHRPGEDRLFRHVAEATQQTDHGDQAEQGREGQHAVPEQDRDRGHRQGATHVGDDADPAYADPVQQRTAEAAGQHVRQHLRGGDQAGPGRAAGQGQHEPGQRHHRHPGAGGRNHLGGQQPDQRTSRPAGHDSSPATAAPASSADPGPVGAGPESGVPAFRNGISCHWTTTRSVPAGAGTSGSSRR